MGKKFYVIWKGAQTGIFTSWPEVNTLTQGRADAQYMGFESKSDAEQAWASSYTKALMKRSMSKKSSSSPTKKSFTDSNSTKKSSKTSANAMFQADIEIYCDGACSPNPGQSGTGLAVYEKTAGTMTLTALYYGLYQAMGTNNTAELNGLLSAFRLTQHIVNKTENTGKRVAILSDSKYSIDCITKWAKGWQAKGWTRGKGEEIKNLTLVQQCFKLYQSLSNNIYIQHVKGHANIEGNELSDRMAVLARKNKQATLTHYTGELDIKKILAMESG